MTARKCLVEVHLDHQTGAWWAGCSDCRFSAAADSLEELKRLIRGGHAYRYRLDLVVDNLPPTNGTTYIETIIDWTVTT